MTNSRIIQIKRLKFRSCHRGMKETDALLGGFAQRYLDELNDQQLNRFEALLEENDIDIFQWITGKKPVPPELDHDVMRLIIKFKKDL